MMMMRDHTILRGASVSAAWFNVLCSRDEKVRGANSSQTSNNPPKLLLLPCTVYQEKRKYNNTSRSLFYGFRSNVQSFFIGIAYHRIQGALFPSLCVSLVLFFFHFVFYAVFFTCSTSFMFSALMNPHTDERGIRIFTHILIFYICRCDCFLIRFPSFLFSSSFKKKK